MVAPSTAACNFVPAQDRRPQCQFAPVLCVLPTTWPLPVVTNAVLTTWAQHCDRLVLTVRAEQLAVPMFGKLAGGLHVDVLPSHNHSVLSGRQPLSYCSGMDIWYDVREAIRVAAEQCPIHAFEWLLVSETDVYVSMSRVKEFLTGKAPDEARVFAHCKSYEKYWHGDSGGMYLYSRRAVQKHLPILESCQALNGRSKFATQMDRMRKAAGLVKPTVTTRCGASDKSIGVCMFLANVSCEVPKDEYNRSLIAEPENDAEHDNVSQGLAFDVGHNSILPIAIHDKKVLKLPGTIEQLSHSSLWRHHQADTLSLLLLGPPWHLRHGVAPQLPSVTDLVTMVGMLPRAHVVDPFHAQVSTQHQGVRLDGTLQLDQRTCVRFKPLRALCMGSFNETTVVVRIDRQVSPARNPADVERAALIENAVIEHLSRLQRHDIHGDEATQLRRYGWTTRVVPSTAFILLLHRNRSRNARTDRLLGPELPDAIHQHIVVSEAADGRPLSRAVADARVPYSLRAVLLATLQVALKVALLQRLTGFVHGDLMGNNVICGNLTADDSTLGECTLIDFESSTLSITKRAEDGGASGAANSSGSRHVMLGRRLDGKGGRFIDVRAGALTSAARAFDMHIYTHWLHRQARAHPQGGDVVQWLARFYERACNVSRGEFDRGGKQLHGSAKHSYLGSGLHACFWPERIADYILHSTELRQRRTGSG